jgi:hypothetical protein
MLGWDSERKYEEVSGFNITAGQEGLKVTPSL